MKPKRTLSFDEKLHDPCIKICVNDASDELCLGCGRKPDEIERWDDLAIAEKTDIINQAETRLDELANQRRKRRAGRKRTLSESAS